jgi:heat shock protein HslJ
MKLFIHIQKPLENRNKTISSLFYVLSLVATVISSGCGSSHPQIRTSLVFDGITFKSMRVPSGNVRLVNGEYREKVLSDNSTEIVVYLDEHTATGKLDQKNMAVAILVSDIGTGEVYYDLALLQETESGWENTDTLELGDRVKIQSVSITDDEIVVGLKVHGPYDRDCCSTMETVYWYQVSGGRMVKKPGASEIDSAPELVGTLWKWQETYYKNDTYVQSYDPNSYTIQLVKGGGLNARADCNMAGGEYVLDGESIGFKISHSTMAACPPESLSEKFLGDLRSAARYYFKNKKLFVVLEDDSGVIVFSY